MDRFLKNAENDWGRLRLTLVFAGMAAAFLVLAFRMFQLQVLHGVEYNRLSANNCIRLQSLAPDRGLIFDRKGNLLVDNRPAYDLVMIPRDARPVEATLSRLAEVTGISPGIFDKAVKKAKGRAGYKPVLLVEDIDREVVAALSGHRYDLPGLRVEVRPRRQYLQPGLAPHLLGYLGKVSARDLKRPENRNLTGDDTVGKIGVEKVYEQELRGRRGGRQVEVNARGQVVRVLRTVPAEPGHNLVLSMDSDLQAYAEGLMEGKAGSIVALDPENGEVLAMVSTPGFDQNLFVRGMSSKTWKGLIENPDRPMENKAIQAEYPPASPYKIVAAMAALEEGLVDSRTRFFCSGSLPYGDRNFRCWKKTGHGSLDLEEAIEHSCDVYFYQVGQRLGVDRLAWYAHASGLGRRTGIDLDNEKGGLVPTAAWKRKRLGRPWRGGETLSVSIGQGYNLSTPLQQAVLIAAIANGGTLYRPRVVKEIRTATGERVHGASPEVLGTLPASPRTLKLIQKGLWDVVNRRTGTAHRIRHPEIEIYGKTGTAQVISRKGEDADGKPKVGFEPHAWFVSYASHKGKSIAVAVIVEHGEAGSSAAGPVARDVVVRYLEGGDV